MSSKADLQSELNEIGYYLGPFTSNDTLLNIIRLHSMVLTDRNTNVAQLSDLELRKNLTQRGLRVGPVTSHTRSIYQRKLLEVLTNEPTEGEEDEIDESTLDISNENKLYSNLSDKNSFSYGLRNTYDEPMIIRHDYKATTSSRDTLTRNTYGNRNLYDNSTEIRPRISTRSNEQQPIKINQDLPTKKVDDSEKLQVATKTDGTFFYAGITIVVALIVFVLYFLLVK